MWTLRALKSRKNSNDQGIDYPQRETIFKEIDHHLVPLLSYQVLIEK